MGGFLLIRLLLKPWLGLSAPYLHFYPAVILAAHLAGFGPGILATALATAAATWFFFPPTHTFIIASLADRLSVVLFFGIGCGLVALVESARRSELAARKAAAAADAHARELEAVFEAIPDGVFVGTGDRITKANAAGLEMLGATSIEELNSDVATLAERLSIRFADTGAPLSADDLQFTRALRGEPAMDIVTARRLDTGEERVLRSSAAPIRGGDGVVGAVVVNADVTSAIHESRRLEEASQAVSSARQRLAQVVANVPGVVWEAWGEPDAASQRIDFVSDYVRTMLGYEPAEWTSTPNFWLTIVHPEDRDRAAREASAIFASGAPGRSEFRWMHKRGSIVWVEAHSNVIVDGEGAPLGMRGVTLDISVRKRLELERAELLAREQAARADAVAANRLKDDFLATLSHELRTPLNAILGYARMLRGGVIDPARQARALEIVERNATSLTQMVEDVLDVSRVMSGKIRLNLTTIDLSRIVEDSIATVRPAADAKGVVIRTSLNHDAGPISGDADRLQQVVWNLLSNAVRFTPREGNVEIRLERNGGDASITVRDTGAGIEPGFLPHVFERFRQADSRPSREYGGLGLGLAIARDLVELHGGSIQVASDGAGRGATFTVTLPVSERVPRNYSGPPGMALGDLDAMAGTVLAGVRVLVVDDDRDALMLMREVLEAAGAIVSEASSAPAALALLATERPDAIVSDLGMPGMDGYAFVAELRASPVETLRNVPAVALTAYARSEDRTRALRSGFQMHLSKPIDPGEVVAGVAALVSGKKR
jgi:PAS domain S-box-containing protein